MVFQLFQICWHLYSRWMEKETGKSRALEPLFEALPLSQAAQRGRPVRIKLWPLLCSGMKFQGMKPNLGDPSAKLLLKHSAGEDFH